jgi:hypothetical protein
VRVHHPPLPPPLNAVVTVERVVLHICNTGVAAVDVALSAVTVEEVLRFFQRQDIPGAPVLVRSPLLVVVVVVPARLLGRSGCRPPRHGDPIRRPQYPKSACTRLVWLGCCYVTHVLVATLRRNGLVQDFEQSFRQPQVGAARNAQANTLYWATVACGWMHGHPLTGHARWQVQHMHTVVERTHLGLGGGGAGAGDGMAIREIRQAGIFSDTPLR